MAKEGKTIFQNTLVLTSVELMARLMSLALIIVVARKLGPEIMGVYAFGLAFIGIFEIFGNFGLEPYIQREVSRRIDISGRLMSRIFGLKLIIFIISVVIIFIFDRIAVTDELKHQVIWILTGTMFFKINFIATNAFFRAHQKAKYEAAVRMTLRFVYTSAGMIAIFAGKGLMALVVLELIAHLTACCMAWGIYIKRIDSPFYRLSLGKTINLVKKTWEFLILQLVLTVFNSIDMVMLSMMADDLSTGFYSATVRLTGAFGFIPSAFTGAFFPALSRQAVDDPANLGRLFRPYFKFLLLLGVGLGAVIAGLSGKFMVLIFSDKFAPAGTTLTFMAFALVLRFASWPLSTITLVLNKERQNLHVFAISASANILLNMALIPMMKDQGAALATILSLIILIALQCRIIGYNMLKQFQLPWLAFGPLVIGSLTWCFVRISNSYSLGLVWILLGAVLTYIVFSLMTKVVNRKEIGMLKTFILKKR